MNIKPRIIPKFQTGGVPQWYLDIYGNRTFLLGWDKNKRYNYANQNLNINDHRNAGNLDTVYRKNIAYTGTPGVITSDIQNFYNTSGNGMSAEDFVKFYNDNAGKIRNHWIQDQTYNARTAGEHNRLFKQMFQSRSNQSENLASDYNIGYQDNLEDIEGSSTWLRRMDQYENEFDINNPDSNRLHPIQLQDGTIATFYKKANGDIGLFSTSSSENPNSISQTTLPEVVVTGTDKSKKQTEVQAQNPDNKFKGFDWSKIREVGKNLFNNPNLYALGRLAGNLINNERIYDEALKGINPVLRQTYYTHRQVVGDEATKQGYYRRAAQGQTKASRPFTADADKQVAYMNEAKRIGDELRAQGDLADNAEIRRTSDESNQHQWANVQRATEVANANLASMNQANAQRHNLLAQKHAAQWSSIDNYLLGIETRKRQQEAEAKTINKELFLLQRQREIEDDDILNSLQAEYETLKKKPENQKPTDFGGTTLDRTKPEIIEIEKKIRNRRLELQEETYRRWKNELISAKSGTKITYKKKDDLLYKTAKDVVDHFRKMSKISSDALNRKTPKIEKLTSHPKGKTRRYQSGGVAPFLVYRPATLGGSTEVSSQTGSSKSSKEDSGKDTLDFLKKLFESLQGEGLPIDVNVIYSNLNELFQDYKTFGKELDTSDLSLLYLKSMQQLNNIKHSKDIYNKAKTVATTNEALNEYAVTADGSYIVQNKDANSQDYGKIDFIKQNFSDIDRNKYTLLTNQHLLYLREYSPQLLLRKGDFIIENVINNGMGINKIGAQIKALAGNIGSTDSKIDGITKVESDKIKAGIKELQEAPEGYYKITQEIKNPNSQINYALQYIANMLSPSQRAILDAHGGTKTLIGYFLNSQAKYETNLSIDPLSGKASKDGNGYKSSDNLEMNYALKLLTGRGEPKLETFGIGNNNVFHAFGRSSTIASMGDNEIAFGADFSYNDLYKSGVGRILGMDNACFGDVPINKAMKDSIIIDNDRIVGVDLPYRREANGRIIPDFRLLQKIEEADKEALKQNLNPETNPQDVYKINQIYASKGLPIKYNSSNKLSSNYMRFAVIQATASEDAFLEKDGLSSNRTLTLVTDDNEIEKYERLMSEITKDKNYSLKKSEWYKFGNKDIYKGSIFIPITGDITDAALAGGHGKMTTGSTTNVNTLTDEWHTRNYVNPLNQNKSQR